MKPWFSENAVDLLNNLINVDHKARIQDIDSIKIHPFFNGLNWDALYNREIDPPFKPCRLQQEGDIRNFDRCFTNETPKDSVVFSRLNTNGKLKNVYEGFSYKDPTH